MKQVRYWRGIIHWAACVSLAISSYILCLCVIMRHSEGIPIDRDWGLLPPRVAVFEDHQLFDVYNFGMLCGATAVYVPQESVPHAVGKQMNSMLKQYKLDECAADILPAILYNEVQSRAVQDADYYANVRGSACITAYYVFFLDRAVLVTNGVCLSPAMLLAGEYLFLLDYSTLFVFTAVLSAIYYFVLRSVMVLLRRISGSGEK